MNEQSVEQDITPATLAPEQTEKKPQEIKTKVISTSPLPQDIVLKLQALVLELKSFREESLNATEILVAQDSANMQLIKKLSDMQIIKVAPDRLDKRDPAVEFFLLMYSYLLKHIDQALNECSPLADPSTTPAQITVSQDESDSFIEYITTTIATLKRFLKREKKEVQVALSRCNFNVHKQSKQLEYLESLAQHYQPTTQEASTPPASL